MVLLQAAAAHYTASVNHLLSAMTGPASTSGEERYLSKLTDALRAVRAAPTVQTKEFTVLCDQIIHLMDFLGGLAS